MQNICLLLSVLLFFNTPIFSMQLTRVAKKTPHHKTYTISHRFKTDTPRPKNKLTITYEDQTYTPTEFARQVSIQALSKGVDYAKRSVDKMQECSDSNISCTCRLPYNCMKKVDMPQYVVVSNYDDARNRLKKTIEYLDTHHATPKHLLELQETLCPNTETCYKKARTEARHRLYKKPVPFFLASAAASTMIPALTIVPLLTGVYLFCVVSNRSDDVMDSRASLSPCEETSLRHMYEETKKINLVLEQIEPLVMQYSQRPKKTGQCYLPLPKKD